MRKLEQRAWPWDLQRTVAANSRLKLEICPSDRALLNFLIAKLRVRELHEAQHSIQDPFGHHQARYR